MTMPEHTDEEKELSGVATFKTPLYDWYEKQGVLAAMRRLSPAPQAGQVTEVNLLNELVKHPGWELNMGYDGPNEDNAEYGWCVHERSGNHNDREWTLIGFGYTPQEALRAALSLGKGA